MKTPIITVAATVLAAAAAQSAVVYNSLTGTRNANNTQHYLELVTLQPTASPAYTINSIPNLSVQWSSISNGNQDIYVQVYSNANPASATGVLSGATFLGGGAIMVAPTALGENDLYTINLQNTFGQAGITVGATTTLAFEFLLTTLSTNPYANSTGLIGNFTQDTAPTVGVNTTGQVYSNSNINNDFVVTDLTTFGHTTESVRFSVDATPVPEPTSLVFSMIAGCVLLGSVIRFRGSRVAA